MLICTRMCDDNTTEHTTRKPPTGPKPRQPIHKIYSQSITTHTMTKSAKRNKTRSPCAKIIEDNYMGTKYSPTRGRHSESYSKSVNEYSITSDEDQNDTSSGSSSAQREYLVSAYRGSDCSTLSENDFSQLEVAQAVIKAEHYEKSSHQVQSFFFWLVIMLVGIIICWFITTNTWYSKSDELSKTGIKELFNEMKFINDMVGLRKNFPSQNDSLWTELITGIKDLANGANQPAIFLLLSVHDETTNCLARKVAKIARSALRGKSELIVRPEELENNGSRILAYKEEITQGKVVIILDILSIEPEALKGFHDILDHHNPVVDEAVYLITMQSKLYDIDRPDNNAIEYAERQLRDKFSKLISADKLEPLIVRITAGGILPIRAEETFPCT